MRNVLLLSMVLALVSPLAFTQDDTQPLEGESLSTGEAPLENSMESSSLPDSSKKEKKRSHHQAKKPHAKQKKAKKAKKTAKAHGKHKAKKTGKHKRKNAGY